MLRMGLLGLLILLSVGMLSAMELSSPPRRAVAIVQPPAEQDASLSASHEDLAKADRLEIAAVTSAMTIPAAAAEPPVAPEGVHIGLSAPRPSVHPVSKPKPIASAAAPKAKPKPQAVVKRGGPVQRVKTASETERCRLKAFGGLLKALNLTGCEI